MKLLFLCALLAPAHGTILRGGVSLDASVLHPDGLESMVMSLARSKNKQTPEMTALRAQLKEIILKLVPSPEAELVKAQAALDLAYQNLQTCKQDHVTSNKTAFTGLVGSYKTTREAEVAALAAKKKCNDELAVVTEAKNTECNKRDSLSAARCLTFSSGGMSQNNPGSSATCPSGSSSEDYVAYVNRAVAWLVTQKDAYQKGKVACEAKTTEHTAKKTECSGLDAAYTKARADSLGKQGALDEASCGLHDVCTRYSTCIKTQSDNYEAAKKIALAQQEKMRAEWTNIQRMLCVVDNLGKACTYIEFKALADAKLKIVPKNSTLPEHTTACTSLVAGIPKAGTADYKAKYYDGLIVNASQAPAEECKASCCPTFTYAKDGCIGTGGYLIVNGRNDPQGTLDFCENTCKNLANCAGFQRMNDFVYDTRSHCYFYNTALNPSGIKPRGSLATRDEAKAVPNRVSSWMCVMKR